jgi:hypothetical protein
MLFVQTMQVTTQAEPRNPSMKERSVAYTKMSALLFVVPAPSKKKNTTQTPKFHPDHHEAQHGLKPTVPRTKQAKNG